MTNYEIEKITKIFKALSNSFLVIVNAGDNCNTLPADTLKLNPLLRQLYITFSASSIAFYLVYLSFTNSTPHNKPIPLTSPIILCLVFNADRAAFT